MKITNKHVAIAAGVLGLMIAGHYMGEAQRAEEAQAAAAAYDALPAEEKIVIDLRERMKPFYLEGGNVGLGAAARDAFKAGLEGKELEKDCGIDCLIAADDVKKHITFTEDAEQIHYEHNTSEVAFFNAMLEKEYPKNGNGVPSCVAAKLTYWQVLDLYEELDGNTDKIVMRFKAQLEQRGGEWGERQQKVAGGMAKFANLHYYYGIKGIEKILHGKDAPRHHANKWHSEMAKEFENMCYDKGNVGMIQTLMLVDKYYE